MSRRIAVIGHLRHPIAAPFRGGMEVHCHTLVRGLVARGHAVSLFASADSDPALPLHPIAAHHYEAVFPWAHWRGTDALTAFQDAAFARAWGHIADGRFDVVHNNTMHPALHLWAERDGIPMVTSLHVPPFDGLANAVARHRAPWLRQTTTSDAHRYSWRDIPDDGMSVVYNGIDLAAWTFRPRGNGRAVWSGRITPTKGTAVAIDAARRAGVALDLYGPIDCQTYFDEEVTPRLDRLRIYQGHRGGPALAEAIGAASVMIATPLWDEPFGLVAAEALACGVPVAALDRGALREIVGEAGILVAATDELPAAIRAALAVPRAICRERAERFGIERMIAGYEAAYDAAIAGARASSSARTRALLA